MTSAHIGGALPIFDPAGCTILLRDSSSSREIFAPTAFDESFSNKGAIELQVNHGDGGTLSGHYRDIRNDGGSLRWSFALRDGVLERRMLQAVKRGELRGLSFAFDRCQERFAWPATAVQTRGRLREISLVISPHRPQWFGTRCWVEAEW